jgi:hypothetical protein
MKHFTSQVDGFNAQLEEITVCHNYLKQSKEFRSIIFPLIKWDLADIEQKETINKHLKKDLPPKTLLNSFFITTSACYEHFLRNVLMATIAAIDKKTEHYNDLTLKLRNKHLQSTGSLISNHASPPAFMKLDYKKLCENIATCYDGSIKFNLNPEIALFPKGLVGLESFFSFLELCEITINFEVLAKDEAIKKFLEPLTVKEREKELKRLHEELLRLRNTISHSGLENADLSTQILETYINLLKVESLSICEIIEAYLNKS